MENNKYNIISLILSSLCFTSLLLTLDFPQKMPLTSYSQKIYADLNEWLNSTSLVESSINLPNCEQSKLCGYCKTNNSIMIQSCVYNLPGYPSFEYIFLNNKCQDNVYKAQYNEEIFFSPYYPWVPNIITMFFRYNLYATNKML